MGCNKLGTCTLYFFIATCFTLKLVAVNCSTQFWGNDYRVNQKYPIDLISVVPNNKHYYNLLTSPPAIRIVLLATALVAKGQTRDDIHKLLYGGKYADLINSFKYLKKRYAVRTEAKIYLNQNMDVTPCVSRWISNFTYKIDYSNNIESAKIINQWVKDMTNNTVPQIVLPSFHKPEPFLTLVHITYLSARWKKPFVNIFAAKSTVDGKQIFATTLHQNNVFRYSRLDDLGVIALELPLTKNAKMVVLQPLNYTRNFQALKKKLLKSDIRTLSSRLQKTRISLFFPVLNSIKMDRSMIPTLNTFNITKPFMQDADFRNLHSCGDETYIRMFNQRSRINVHQHGVRVGSATGVQWAYPSINNQVISDDDEDNGDEEELFEDDDDISTITVAPNKKLPQVSLLSPFFYAIVKDNIAFWMGTIYKPTNEDRDIFKYPVYTI